MAIFRWRFAGFKERRLSLLSIILLCASLYSMELDSLYTLTMTRVLRTKSVRTKVFRAFQAFQGFQACIVASKADRAWASLLSSQLTPFQLCIQGLATNKTTFAPAFNKLIELIQKDLRALETIIFVSSVSLSRSRAVYQD